jgi:hypothetical protein
MGSPVGNEMTDLLKKWQFGIGDISLAKDEQLNSYVDAKLQEYQLYNSIDTELWEIYQDDFKAFTEPHFSNLKLRTKQRLRNSLRSRGVYVPPYTRTKPLGTTLFEIAQEEEQHQWTTAELDDLQAEFQLGELHSKKLLKTLQPSVHPLTQSLPQPSPQPSLQTQLSSTTNTVPNTLESEHMTSVDPTAPLPTVTPTSST